MDSNTLLKTKNNKAKQIEFISYTSQDFSIYDMNSIVRSDYHGKSSKQINRRKKNIRII